MHPASEHVVFRNRNLLKMMTLREQFPNVPITINEQLVEGVLLFSSKCFVILKNVFNGQIKSENVYGLSSITQQVIKVE